MNSCFITFLSGNLAKTVKREDDVTPILLSKQFHDISAYSKSIKSRSVTPLFIAIFLSFTVFLATGSSSILLRKLQTDRVVFSTNLLFKVDVLLPLVTGELLQKTIDSTSYHINRLYVTLVTSEETSRLLRGAKRQV